MTSALAWVRPAIPPPVRRFALPVIRVGGALAVLYAVAVKFGGGPFLHGVQSINAPVLGFALAVTGLTTLCSAWRWSVVARALGVHLPLRVAVPAYYRSQFLNSVLPGGVVGDVQRAVVHGRQTGDLRRGLRAVAWERLAGQGVQVTVAVMVLLLLPSPVRPFLPVGIAVLGGVCLLCLALRRLGRPRVVADDVPGLLARGVLLRVAVASVLTSAGHIAVFVAAAWSVGSPGSLAVLVPLALVAQLAMTIPLTIGGWGPREGVAAWAFAASGLGASTGLAVATAYGVLALVAVLPGAVGLARNLVRRRTPAAPGVSCSAAAPGGH